MHVVLNEILDKSTANAPCYFSAGNQEILK